MDIVVGIVTIIFFIVSLINNAGKNNTKKKTQVPDWKRTFKETPTKLGTEKATVTTEIKKIPQSPVETKSTTKSKVAPQTVKTTVPTVEFIDWDQELAEINDLELKRGPVVQKESPIATEQSINNPLFELTTDPEALQKAMILKEVLGKPRALEPFFEGRR